MARKRITSATTNSFFSGFVRNRWWWETLGRFFASLFFSGIAGTNPEKTEDKGASDGRLKCWNVVISCLKDSYLKEGLFPKVWKEVNTKREI